MKKWSTWEVALIIVCLITGFWYLFYYPQTLHKLEMDISSWFVGKELDSLKLTENMVIGQSFVCKNDNLARIEVEIKKFDYRKGKMIFHLRKGINDSKDIVTMPLSVGALEGFSISKFFLVNIPVQHNSKNHEYYFFVESFGDNDKLEVIFSKTDRYKEGMMYVNHKPLPTSDLVFRTRYLAKIQNK